MVYQQRGLNALWSLVVCRFLQMFLIMISMQQTRENSERGLLQNKCWFKRALCITNLSEQRNFRNESVLFCPVQYIDKLTQFYWYLYLYHLNTFTFQHGREFKKGWSKVRYVFNRHVSSWFLLMKQLENHYYFKQLSLKLNSNRLLISISTINKVVPLYNVLILITWFFI